MTTPSSRAKRSLISSAGRWPLRLGVVIVVMGGTLGMLVEPASAHGVGKRGDLPLPLWQFVWAAVIALAVSVGAAGILWTSPRLRRLSNGREAPPLLDRATPIVRLSSRAIGLAIFAITLYAAFFVDESLSRNIAPFSIFVALWVGLQFVSAVFGDLYRSVNPLDTIVQALEKLLRLDQHRAGDRGFDHWPAAVSMLGFLWLELAYHEPSEPRLLGWLMLVYSVFHIVMALRVGRRWLETGEAFAALFTIIAALSPLARDSKGRLRLRLPGSGLAAMEVLPGTGVLILVTLGGTSFDGLSRTSFWGDIAASRSGWTLTFVNSLGLLWMIAIAFALYSLATRRIAAVADGDSEAAFVRFVPSLVPIMVGYAVAHYFSLFLLDGGQDFLILLSDPFDQGWSLFGTRDWTVNFLLVSATTIAWVQALGIILGHIAGVLVAHDKALDVYDGSVAVRSQYPMVGVMMIYTVGALVLLLGA